MSYPIKGEDVVLELLYDGNYYPVLCATDCTFSRQMNFVPITSTDSGIFREFMPGKEEWSMSVSGLTKVENDAALTFFWVLQTSVRRQLQTIRMTFTDEVGASKQISGSVYVGSQDISGPISDYAQCSIEFRGTGAFSVSATTPPAEPEINVYSDYWTPTNGLTYITGASSGSYTGTSYTLLSTDTILEVRVEGTSYEVVSSAPADGARECRFMTGPVRVQFPSALVFSGSERVFVMFKRSI